MSAKTAEDFCNTETEEGTIAIQRKRSRRVSFAEITSVHLFDKDDEYETPPEPKPSSDDPEYSAQSNEGGLEFLRCCGEDSSQNDENQEENDEDDLDGRRSFFQPFDSPSPGSAIGSATSNDEDNFFGPVSASFIKPGRLSDSAASDENHEITMDSTAFSMHFRSLARSDSGGDLKTPTGVHLSFEEKTPTQNTLSTNVVSSMVLTVAKPISESSTSVDKLSGSTYSNDTRLVGQDPQRYDYGRLSPGLDALLAEVSKDLHAVSVSDNTPISMSIINLKSGFSPSKDSEPTEPNDGRKKEMGTIDTADLQTEVVTFTDKKLDEANGGYNISPVGQITYGVLSDMRNAPASDVSVDKSPNHLTKVTQSPSRKEHPNATHNDGLHSFVVEEMLSPNSNYQTDSFGNFHVRKRRREDTIPGDSLLLDEITRIRRSPDHHRNEIYSKSLSERSSESNTETSTAVHKETLEHWTDVFLKLSADAKQLFSPSTHKLRLQAIGKLEDVLANLRRVQIYDMLRMEIRPQKLSQNLISSDYRRFEMKQLLHRFVHEQAKSQLMLMKRARLMKQLQLLGSGIQESQALKLNFLPRLSAPCARDSCVDKSDCQSFNFEGIHEEEVPGNKVAALRQVLDDLEGKVMSLSQSFLDYCEKKGQPNHANTILFVNDLLKKKACCRSIRLDMLLWDVDNLESGNDHHNIVLNYAGFIIQRFGINVGPVSSIVISNKLNDVNILKRFPYMDVRTAFAFVLNANTTRKYVGSLSLIQETQTSGSVLGNLLDVAEELQAASVELQNMTHTNFHSPSVKQLELDLHFIDFKSGRKAALSLDMSCLKWGIYPSDAIPVIPHPLEGPPDVSRKSLPEQHLAEIRVAVQSLRVGYSRIMRLCRCVSEVVQAQSG